MKHLQNPEYSFLVIPAYPGITSYLYSRDYFLYELKSYFNGNFEDCYLAFTEMDSSELRKDSLHLIEHFGPDEVYVKYKNDTLIRSIHSSGGESPYSILEYNTNPNYKSYIYGGVSFSFQEAAEYYYPTNKSDLKNGMIVECLTTKGWQEKLVENSDIEYQKSYGLLMKYQKLRIKKNKIY
jgi:hypothetical protein